MFQLDTAQGTPSSSPEKVYTPLKVATPDPLKPTLVGESPVEASLQIVEEATEKASPNPGLPGCSSERRELSEPSGECQLTGNSPIITKSSASSKPMEASLGDFAQDLFGGLNPPGISQTPTPSFSQLIQEEGSYLLVQGSSSIPAPSDPNIQDRPENPTAAEGFPNDTIYPVTTLPSLSITRQEILVLYSVLYRIPQSFITRDDAHLDLPLTLTVIDDVTLVTSSQEEMTANVSTDIALNGVEEGATMIRGKRRRPNYSLTGSMFKRHPVLKFSATVPLDKNKTPFR